MESLIYRKESVGVLDSDTSTLISNSSSAFAQWVVAAAVAAANRSPTRGTRVRTSLLWPF